MIDPREAALRDMYEGGRYVDSGLYRGMHDLCPYMTERGQGRLILDGDKIVKDDRSAQTRECDDIHRIIKKVGDSRGWFYIRNRIDDGEMTNLLTLSFLSNYKYQKYILEPYRCMGAEAFRNYIKKNWYKMYGVLFIYEPARENKKREGFVFDIDNTCYYPTYIPIEEFNSDWMYKYKMEIARLKKAEANNRYFTVLDREWKELCASCVF